MPMAVLATTIDRPSRGSARHAILMRPPSGLNLIALVRRLSTQASGSHRAGFFIVAIGAALVVHERRINRAKDRLAVERQELGDRPWLLLADKRLYDRCHRRVGRRRHDRLAMASAQG